MSLKKSEREREAYLRNIRFIDRRAFMSSFPSSPENDPQKEILFEKLRQREYLLEIRREKGELRILHFKLFLLMHENLIDFLRHLWTGRN